MLHLQNYYPVTKQSLLQDPHQIYRQKHRNLWDLNNFDPVHVHLNLPSTEENPSSHQILSNRQQKFEKKVKLLNRIHYHLNLFLNRPAVKAPRNIKKLTPKLKVVTSAAPSSNTHSNTSRKKRRSRSLRKNHSILDPNDPGQFQVTQNIFDGGKKTVRIFNICQPSNSSESLTLTRPCHSFGPHSHSFQSPAGQIETTQLTSPCCAMGDHVTIDPVSTNDLPMPQVEGTHFLSSGQLEQRIFSPVCTPQILNSDQNLLSTRFSSHLLDEPEILHKIGQIKKRRALQLQIVQEKIEKDGQRSCLEFNENLDKGWIVIHQEMEEVRGQMLLIRRSIQSVDDSEIIIHENMESSILHKRLEESAQEFHDFVRNLESRGMRSRQNVNNNRDATIEECERLIPSTNMERSQNEMNHVSLTHSQKPSPILVEDEFWFARQFNFTGEKLDKRKKRDLSKFVRLKSQDLKRLRENLVRTLCHMQQSVGTKGMMRGHRDKGQRSNLRSTLVII